MEIWIATILPSKCARPSDLRALHGAPYGKLVIMEEQLGDQLLAPLTPEQQAVVNVVADAFFGAGMNWPLFQYVEWKLDQFDIDLRKTAATFPVVGGTPAWATGPFPPSTRSSTPTRTARSH